MCGPLSSPASAVAHSSLDDTIERALRALARRQRLSPTLEERLVEIARGLSYRQIALRHELSEHTVKNEARYLLDGLGLNCRHLIDSAVRAASLRFERTPQVDAVVQYLSIRLE